VGDTETGLSVGFVVGDEEGRRDGDTLETEGQSVLGEAEGLWVGEVVVGILVGEWDGLDEGAIVVGWCDFIVGDVVGILVGECVGDDTGVADGELLLGCSVWGHFVG